MLLDVGTRTLETAPAARNPFERAAQKDSPQFDFDTGGVEVRRACRTASDYLREWDFDGTQPPVESVLDDMCPNWQISHKTSDRCTLEQIEDKRDYYEDVFRNVARMLRSLVNDKDVSLREFKLSQSLLPHGFGGDPMKAEVLLPRPIIDWIYDQRQTRAKHEKKLALLDTFLLLMVIGALGSLTFLIRDFVTSDSENTVADYVFRPLLGIFLAMGMFVLDVLAHSILSTAGLGELRYEPLYVLALAAGLLSEQAYRAIELRADRAIAEYRRRSEEPNHQTT